MWREGDPRLARAKRINAIYISAATGLFIIVVVVMFESKLRWWSTPALLPFLILFWSGHFFVESRRSKVKESLRRHLTAPKIYDVDMEIRLRKTAIGSDFGYLWVENGLLCFEGNQTSFKLPDTLDGLRGNNVGPLSKSVSLFFQTESGLEAELRFTCYLGAIMSDAIRAWQTGPVQTLGTVMPPLTFMPPVLPAYLTGILLGEFIVTILAFAWFLWVTMDPQYRVSTLFALIMILVLLGSAGTAAALQARKRSELRHYLDSLPRLGGKEATDVA